MNIVKRIIGKAKAELEDKIKEETRHYEYTLSDVSRIRLIRLHEDYKLKFRKEYKG